ncbi:MAG: hypothetical protein HQL76_03005 [Magnetococcales bacterium]|nr:hypothetical protein [Magnetococcales bacterium]
MVGDKLRRIPTLWNPSSGVATLLLRQGAGTVALLIGILLSIPGIPGPGFVLIFLGLLLLDFPGKRRLITRFSGQRWFRVTRVFLRKRLRILLEMKPPIVTQDPE